MSQFFSPTALLPVPSDSTKVHARTTGLSPEQGDVHAPLSEQPFDEAFQSALGAEQDTVHYLESPSMHGNINEEGQEFPLTTWQSFSALTGLEFSGDANQLMFSNHLQTESAVSLEYPGGINSLSPWFQTATSIQGMRPGVAQPSDMLSLDDNQFKLPSLFETSLTEEHMALIPSADTSGSLSEMISTVDWPLSNQSLASVEFSQNTNGIMASHVIPVLSHSSEMIWDIVDEQTLKGFQERPTDSSLYALNIYHFQEEQAGVQLPYQRQGMVAGDASQQAVVGGMMWSSGDRMESKAAGLSLTDNSSAFSASALSTAETEIKTNGVIGHMTGDWALESNLPITLSAQSTLQQETLVGSDELFLKNMMDFQDQFQSDAFIQETQSPARELKEASVVGGRSSSPGVFSTHLTQSMFSTGFDQQLNERIIWLSSQNIQAAQIHITPEELGPIDIKISMQEDRPSINFISQHGVVRDLLENNIPRLREIFEQQGLELNDVVVSDQHQQSDERYSESGSQSSGLNQDGTSQGNSDENGEEEAVEELTVGNTSLSSLHRVDYFA